MWSWPSSSSGKEGWPLTAWALGVVGAAWIFLPLFWTPPWAFWAFLVGAGAALGGAFWASPGVRWVFWGLLGFCLGASLSLRVGPKLPPGARVPVRFAGTVADGFQRGERGWSTRLRLAFLEGAKLSRRHVRLLVGGSAHGENLPPPGSPLEGAGELVAGEGGTWLWVKSPLLLRASPPSGWDAWREALRRKLVAAAGFSLPRQRAASLASALVLGRRENLPEEEVASLRAAGLGHLFAVSGLHVGLVAGTFWLLFLWLPPAPRRLLLLPIVAGFAFLAGLAPPVRRAAMATVLLLLARLLGRPVQLLPALWGVVGLLVLLEPGVIGEPGFQLSAATALALVRWVGQARAGLGGGPLAGAVAVALVAQVASSPLLGAHFASVPLLSMPVNLVAVPLAAALVGTALLAVPVASLGAGLAGPLLDLVAFLAAGLRWLGKLGEQGALPFPPLPPALTLSLLLLGTLALLPWRRAWLALVALAVITAGCLLWPQLGWARKNRLALLPVKQGMALLLTGERAQVLVDAGRREREAVALLAERRGGARLDALLLTHPDADHMGGAAFVLEMLRPKAVYLAQAFALRSEFLPLRWRAQQRGIPVYELRPGQRWRWQDLQCDVLWPQAGQSLSDNDASLVLRCTLGGVGVLLVGDLERGGEEALLRRKEVLASPLLQVGHHGSRTSTSWSFLAAVHPRLALIPTGLNPPFPFPHPQVLARLRENKVLPLVQKEGFGEVQVLSPREVAIFAPRPVFLHIGP